MRESVCVRDLDKVNKSWREGGREGGRERVREGERHVRIQ